MCILNGSCCDDLDLLGYVTGTLKVGIENTRVLFPLSSGSLSFIFESLTSCAEQLAVFECYFILKGR